MEHKAAAVDLDEMQRAGDSTAPGPWYRGDEIGHHVSEVWSKCECCGRIAVCDQFGASESTHCYHSDFFVTARNNWDAMIAELRQLRSEAERMRDDNKFAIKSGLDLYECYTARLKELVDERNGLRSELKQVTAERDACQLDIRSISDASRRLGE